MFKQRSATAYFGRAKSNHLDLPGMEELERHSKKYSGADTVCAYDDYFESLL